MTFFRHRRPDGDIVSVELVPAAPPGSSPPRSTPTGASLALGSWLTWPTLRESNLHHPIKGTASYQDNIAIVAGRSASGPIEHLVMAQFHRTTQGPYAGSLAVTVCGLRVGTISADNAPTYGPVLDALAANGQPAQCRAAIYGGHYEPGSEGWRNFGVELLAHQPPEPRRDNDPFLPPHSGVAVDIVPAAAAGLDIRIGGRAKSKRIVVLGTLARDQTRWAVTLAGLHAGWLHPYTDHELDKLEEAARLQFALTCQTRLIREDGKPLRVAVDLP